MELEGPETDLLVYCHKNDCVPRIVVDSSFQKEIKEISSAEVWWLFWSTQIFTSRPNSLIPYNGAHIDRIILSYYCNSSQYPLAEPVAYGLPHHNSISTDTDPILFSIHFLPEKETTL